MPERTDMDTEADASASSPRTAKRFNDTEWLDWHWVLIDAEERAMDRVQRDGDQVVRVATEQAIDCVFTCLRQAIDKAIEAEE